MLRLLFLAGFLSSVLSDSVDDIRCTNAGYFPNPTDCTKFYVCIDWFGNGKRMSIFHFDCPYGTIYDPNLFVCNHAEWIKPVPACAGGHLVVPGPVNVLPDPIGTSIDEEFPPVDASQGVVAANTPIEGGVVTSAEKEGMENLGVTNQSGAEENETGDSSPDPVDASLPNEGGSIPPVNPSPDDVDSGVPNEGGVVTSVEQEVAANQNAGANEAGDSSPDPVGVSLPNEGGSIPSVNPAPEVVDAVVPIEGTSAEQGETGNSGATNQNNSEENQSEEVVAIVVVPDAGPGVLTNGNENLSGGEAATGEQTNGEGNQGSGVVVNEVDPSLFLPLPDKERPAESTPSPTTTATKEEIITTTSSGVVSTKPGEEFLENSNPSSSSSGESNESGIVASVVSPGGSEEPQSSGAVSSENQLLTTTEKPENPPVEPNPEIPSNQPGLPAVSEAPSSATEQAASSEKPAEEMLSQKPVITDPVTASKPKPEEPIKFPGPVKPKPTTAATTAPKPNNSSAISFGPDDYPNIFQLNCGTKEFLRLPTACDRFYKCYWIITESRLGIDLFQCDRGLLFDDVRKKCDKAENVDCPLKASTTFTVAPGSLYNCPEPGHFPYETDCIRFYRCIEVKPGELKGLLYRCPPNYGFSQTTRRCEKQATLPPCQLFTAKSSKPQHSIKLEETTVVLEKDLERFFTTKGFFIP